MKTARVLFFAASFAALARVTSFAADWQWSVTVDSMVSPETNDHPRAFLWIPPDCARVRGVVVGQHNMLEEGILEHADFRRALGELGLAEVWVSPGLDLVFDFTRGAGENFDAMMRALADESGYAELALAPVVPIGHSAAASYPWNFGAWNPGRTLAMLSVKGDAPLTHLTGSGRPNPPWGARTIEGIPGLMVIGEYEWMAARAIPAGVYRGQHPSAPISVSVDGGRGHFDFSDRLVAMLAMFLKKAVEQRLPSEAPASFDAPVTLKPVDPRKGWLVDSARLDAPSAPAAPFSRYTGDKREALWAFDEEMARAIENAAASSRGKTPQLVGFAQEGRVATQDPKTHAQIALSVPALDETLTFRLSGVFLDTAPPGNPAKWSGLAAGSPIAHASGGGPVMLSRICGPIVQTGADTFAIRFYRMGMNSERRSGDIWLLASHPGDEHFKSAVQQANLRIPLRNTEGAEQRITFPGIADQKSSATSVKLVASSDAHVPVYFYVREGPAEIVGDSLVFTKIPPRAKFPLRVTVVAWQWGRTTEPKLKSAEPVERTFSVVR